MTVPCPEKELLLYTVVKKYSIVKQLLTYTFNTMIVAHESGEL
jgi:hypothetical protein